MEPDLRCYHHPEREAASQCDRCGDYLCAECVSEYRDQYLCRKCIKDLNVTIFGITLTVAASLISAALFARGVWIAAEVIRSTGRDTSGFSPWWLVYLLAPALVAIIHRRPGKNCWRWTRLLAVSVVLFDLTLSFASVAMHFVTSIPFLWSTSLMSSGFLVHALAVGGLMRRYSTAARVRQPLAGEK